jgi:hypothetical protein
MGLDTRNVSKKACGDGILKEELKRGTPPNVYHGFDGILSPAK